MHMKYEGLKTVRISDETHADILKCGKMGDSIGDVITRIVKYYMEREMRTKK
jgi:predicted CopG family antitoxin